MEGGGPKATPKRALQSPVKGAGLPGTPNRERKRHQRGFRRAASTSDERAITAAAIAAYKGAEVDTGTLWTKFASGKSQKDKSTWLKAFNKAKRKHEDGRADRVPSGGRSKTPRAAVDRGRNSGGQFAPEGAAVKKERATQKKEAKAADGELAGKLDALHKAGTTKRAAVASAQNRLLQLERTEYEKAHIFAATKLTEEWTQYQNIGRATAVEAEKHKAAIWSRIVEETRATFKGVNWAQSNKKRGCRWPLCPVRKLALRSVEKHLKKPKIDGTPRHLTPPGRPGVKPRVPPVVSQLVQTTSKVLQVSLSLFV